MIVRIFRVSVEPERRTEFQRFFVETAIPLMKRQDGLLTLIPCLPRPESPNDFAMVMVWRDVQSLAAFAGPDWRQPHVAPEEEGLVRTRHLDHYVPAAV